MPFISLSLPLSLILTHAIQVFPSDTSLLSIVGVSYFVYGEKIDVYSDDPKLKEFMDLGLKFIRSIINIAIVLPLYRMHIYTKPYKEYVDTLNKLQDIGMLLL